MQKKNVALNTLWIGHLFIVWELKQELRAWPFSVLTEGMCVG